MRNLNESDPKFLGDRVETVLKTLGADKIAKLIEKVGKRPCGCGGRKEKLNAWHRKVLEVVDDIKSG